MNTEEEQQEEIEMKEFEGTIEEVKELEEGSGKEEEKEEREQGKEGEEIVPLVFFFFIPGPFFFVLFTFSF